MLSKDWVQFNKALMKLGEDEVRQLMLRERRGQCRERYLMRLYGRYSTLRGKRERHLLLSKAVEAMEFTTL